MRKFYRTRARPLGRRAAYTRKVPAPALARRCLAAVAVYLALHVAIRLLAPDSVEHDEAEQLLLAQSLALGYGPHPPLYTWLQHGAFQLLGVGVPALSTLKHLCLFAVYAATLAAARRVLADPGLAALATGALWLLPQLGWEAHRDLTHSVLATALAAATLWAFLGLVARPRIAGYLGLGVLLGLGTLSKYNFVLFAAAGAAAALSLPAFRGVLRDRRLALTLAVALALAGPHLGWLAAHPDTLADEAAGKLGLGLRSGAGVLGGLWELASATLRLVGPAVLIVLACVPGALRPRAEETGPPYRRLIERLLGLVLAALAAGVVLLGVTEMKARWMLPLLSLVPLALVLRVAAAAPPPGRRRLLAAIVVGAALLSVTLRAAEVGLGPWLGRPSRLHVPVAALVAQLRAAGFRGGSIVADDKGLAGNLRLHFPTSRVLTPLLPAVALPVRPDGPGQCLVAWRPRPALEPAPHFLAFAAERLGQAPAAPVTPRVAAAPVPGAPGSSYRVAWLALPAGPAPCRAGWAPGPAAALR
jgi:4-amino-4-deoxy-L-arabinose transferase-like glycosyltransferase